MSYYLRRDPNLMQRYPARSWECYLCGEKFDSEMSKDNHMTRCVVPDMDALDRNSDDSSIRAVRVPESPPAWGDRPPQPPNTGHTPFFGDTDDFSAPVGPKRDTTQPPIAAPQGYIPNQYTPDPMRTRQIQYPPSSGVPPTTNAFLASYLTEGRKNPLFQHSNITSNIPSTGYQPRMPVYMPPQQHQNIPPVLYSRATPPQYAVRAQIPATLPPTQVPAPTQSTQQTFKLRHGEPINLGDPRQNTSPPAATLGPNPYDIRYNGREVPGTNPPTQQRVVNQYNELSASKLLSTRLSEDASVHPVPGVRRADKLEVKLVWEKQQPTLQTELEYFDEKAGRITLSWDRRKEVFLGSARLAPGEHSGTLLISDTDKACTTQPFNVSPHSVGIQEIKIDLVDIAVKSKPAQQPANPSFPNQEFSGRDKAAGRYGALYKEKFQEPQVLQSHHRPLYQPPQARAQEKGVVREETQIDKSSTFLVNSPPQEVPVERPPNSSPFRSLPLSLEKEEPLPFQANEPLPFQENLPREKPIHPNRHQAPPQEERRVETDPPPSLPFPINIPRNRTGNELEALKAKNNELSKEGEGVRVLAERERRLQNEVSEWEGRYRKLKESNQIAERENNVLKREVEQFKVKYVDAMTKLENKSVQRERLASAREVDELKTALLQAKEQMEALKRETEAIMQQSEAQEQNRMRLEQDKLKYAQAERESYKKAAYRYREEREKTKSNLEEMTRAYGEYRQKYTDVVSKLKQREEQLKRFEDKNKLLESELNSLKKIHRQNSNEPGRAAQRETEKFKLNLNFQPVRASHEDTDLVSLGPIRSDSNNDEKRTQKKSNPHKDQTPDEGLPNPYNSLPASLNSVGAVVSPPASKRKLSAVLEQVQKLEQGKGKLTEGSEPVTPKAIPRSFRAVSSAMAEGLELYTPEVLTVFQNKTSPLFYKASPVKSINLGYLKKPESHKNKQVLVKVKEVFWLGYLQTVFSRKHPYLSKTEILVGIRLLEPAGNSSGTYDSVRHFDCPPNHGIFISISEVYVPVL